MVCVCLARNGIWSGVILFLHTITLSQHARMRRQIEHDCLNRFFVIYFLVYSTITAYPSLIHSIKVHVACLFIEKSIIKMDNGMVDVRIT